MRLKGYCEVQKCEYEIFIDEIPSPNLQNQNRVLYGLIDCQYASFGGYCSGECSILKQHGITQG